MGSRIALADRMPAEFISQIVRGRDLTEKSRSNTGPLNCTVSQGPAHAGFTLWCRLRLAVFGDLVLFEPLSPTDSWSQIDMSALIDISGLGGIIWFNQFERIGEMWSLLTQFARTLGLIALGAAPLTVGLAAQAARLYSTISISAPVLCYGEPSFTPVCGARSGAFPRIGVSPKSDSRLQPA